MYSSIFLITPDSILSINSLVDVCVVSLKLLFFSVFRGLKAIMGKIKMD